MPSGNLGGNGGTWPATGSAALAANVAVTTVRNTGSSGEVAGFMAPNFAMGISRFKWIHTPPFRNPPFSPT